jgi:hypothetical protein
MLIGQLFKQRLSIDTIDETDASASAWRMFAHQSNEMVADPAQAFIGIIVDMPLQRFIDMRNFHRRWQQSERHHGGESFGQLAVHEGDAIGSVEQEWNR